MQNVDQKISKSKKRFEAGLSLPYYVVLIVLVVIPIFLMIISSFQLDRSSGIFPISFTLDHYLDFLRATSFVRAMSSSLWIAAATTVVASTGGEKEFEFFIDRRLHVISDHADGGIKRITRTHRTHDHVERIGE